MYCKHNCKQKCKIINFDFNIEVSKQKINKTILEFIPQKSSRISYIEILKTDFDRFIYNCGGILGLSLINAVDLFEYLAQICVVLRVKCLRIALYLYAICKRFVSYLLGLLSQIFTAFYVKCIYFVCHLIVICKRVKQLFLKQ